MLLNMLSSVKNQTNINIDVQKKELNKTSY